MEFLGSVPLFAFFWLVLAPAMTLLHELGHIFPILTLTRKRVSVTLGDHPRS